MAIQLPDDVGAIISILEENGHKAYAVGGCVRDSILCNEPKDWDITTSAKPYEVKSLFKRTIDTGIEHGTVTVMFNKAGYEVTTFRIDGEYEDGRHPKQVEFSKSLKEDLKRRDFTINAMAYNEKEGLIDMFGGLLDLKNGVIRCVGNAKERFDEDALRMLRAVRFSAQLNFTIDDDTMRAIKEDVYKLERVSAERIRMEMNKLLLSDYPDTLITAYYAGITRIILPEFDDMMEAEQENPNYMYNIVLHTLCVLKNIVNKLKGLKGLTEKQRLMLMWSGLLHDMSKLEAQAVPKEMPEDMAALQLYGHREYEAEMAKGILRRLKFDNETISIVERLIKHHDYDYTGLPYGLSPAGIRHAVSIIGGDIIEFLFILQEADILSHKEECIRERIIQLQKAEELYKDMLENQECFCLKDLAVKGDDLIKAGYKPGPELGELLKKLLDHVILNPLDNKKDILLEKAGLYCGQN